MLDGRVSLPRLVRRPPKDNQKIYGFARNRKVASTFNTKPPQSALGYWPPSPLTIAAKPITLAPTTNLHYPLLATRVKYLPRKDIAGVDVLSELTSYFEEKLE